MSTGDGEAAKPVDGWGSVNWTTGVGAEKVLTNMYGEKTCNQMKFGGGGVGTSGATYFLASSVPKNAPFCQ